jgi:hypothetical protein
LENGFLTPTMRIKRNVIEDRYLPQADGWLVRRQPEQGMTYRGRHRSGSPAGTPAIGGLHVSHCARAPGGPKSAELQTVPSQEAQPTEQRCVNA